MEISWTGSEIGRSERALDKQIKSDVIELYFHRIENKNIIFHNYAKLKQNEKTQNKQKHNPILSSRPLLQWLGVEVT